MIPRPPRSTLFPTRRSSDLVMERADAVAEFVRDVDHLRHLVGAVTVIDIDRKSTRLNSSHVEISYAVFCLKKKKKRIVLRYPQVFDVSVYLDSAVNCSAYAA